jgi:hypothetical protein
MEGRREGDRSGAVRCGVRGPNALNGGAILEGVRVDRSSSLRTEHAHRLSRHIPPASEIPNYRRDGIDRPLVALLVGASTRRDIEGEEEAFILSGGAASAMAKGIRSKQEEERRRQAWTRMEGMADTD